MTELTFASQAYRYATVPKTTAHYMQILLAFGFTFFPYLVCALA